MRPSRTSNRSQLRIPSLLTSVLRNSARSRVRKSNRRNRVIPNSVNERTGKHPAIGLRGHAPACFHRAPTRGAIQRAGRDTGRTTVVRFNTTNAAPGACPGRLIGASASLQALRCKEPVARWGAYLIRSLVWSLLRCLSVSTSSSPCSSSATASAGTTLRLTPGLR